MARYSNRENSWSFSSSALGWGITGLAILLVGFLLIGGYIGYGMGYDQGRKDTRAELEQSQQDRLSALSGPQQGKDASSDTEGETESTSGAFEEDELGFLNETTDEESSNQAESNQQDNQQSSQQKSDDTVESDRNQPESGQSDQQTSVMESMTEGSDEGEQTDPPSQQAESGQDTENVSGSNDQTQQSPELVDQDGPVYTIQASSSRQEDNARRRADQLTELGYEVTVREKPIDGSVWYRVRVGEFSSRSSASSYAEKMVEEGDIQDYWVSRLDDDE